MGKESEISLFQSINRSSVVGFAMICDIIINYPLWVAAKRIGANLNPFPNNIKTLYQGGGVLWLSLGPTTIVEDFVTRILSTKYQENNKIIHTSISGIIAALTITSQVEHIITLSHVKNITIIQTIQQLYKQNKIQILFPPGMIAMIGREVPFSTSLFYLRPLIEKQFISSHHHHEHEHEHEHEQKHSDGQFQINFERFLIDLKCGFLTSLVATPISHPASVIASYQQGHNQTLFQSISIIYQSNGWKSFFRGLTARTLSLTGTFTIVPMILRVLSPLYQDNNDNDHHCDQLIR